METNDPLTRLRSVRSITQSCRWTFRELQLAQTAGTTVQAIAEQDKAFSESVDGRPALPVRLSNEKLS